MVNLEPIFIRERVIQLIRNFFETKKFHEVITPSMSPGLTIEPNIFPFSTTWNTNEENKTLYLITSPEVYMKKMLSLGIGNCYSIGKSFRNLEGAGSQHIPEFLMLEWYREHANYYALMDDAQEMIGYINSKIKNQKNENNLLSYQGLTIDLSKKWPILSLETLFSEYSDLKLSEIVDDTLLYKIAEERGYITKDASWNELYDQLFVNEIESKLPKTPFFLIDFPARTSPLCKVNKNKPYLSERFEMYMFGMEVANGNNENTDSKAVKRLFEKENSFRKNNNLPYSEIDEEFIKALEELNGREYAGVGLGVDRLAMIFANTTDITDIEIFYK